MGFFCIQYDIIIQQHQHHPTTSSPTTTSEFLICSKACRDEDDDINMLCIFLQASLIPGCQWPTPVDFVHHLYNRLLVTELMQLKQTAQSRDAPAEGTQHSDPAQLLIPPSPHVWTFLHCLSPLLFCSDDVSARLHPHLAHHCQHVFQLAYNLICHVVFCTHAHQSAHLRPAQQHRTCSGQVTQQMHSKRVIPTTIYCKMLAIACQMQQKE
jgi:hypothetical protein